MKCEPPTRPSSQQDRMTREVYLGILKRPEWYPRNSKRSMHLIFDGSFCVTKSRRRLLTWTCVGDKIVVPSQRDNSYKSWKSVWKFFWCDGKDENIFSFLSEAVKTQHNHCTKWRVGVQAEICRGGHCKLIIFFRGNTHLSKIHKHNSRGNGTGTAKSLILIRERTGTGAPKACEQIQLLRITDDKMLYTGVHLSGGTLKYDCGQVLDLRQLRSREG